MFPREIMWYCLVKMNNVMLNKRASLLKLHLHWLAINEKFNAQAQFFCLFHVNYL